MSSAWCLLAVAIAAFALPASAAAQSPSPTLPSDTLEANFAPRSAPGPVPELAPSLPTDTLDIGAPMTYPDSATGEMRRDWDQDEDAAPWRHDDSEDEDDGRMQALQFKLG
jgi:hypothetical protein